MGLQNNELEGGLCTQWLERAWDPGLQSLILTCKVCPGGKISVQSLGMRLCVRTYFCCSAGHGASSQGCHPGN